MIDPEKKQELEDRLEAYKEQRDQQKGWLQRRFGCLGGLLALILVFLVNSVIHTIFDAAASPWAYSFFGTRPTLVGEWTGAFTTPSGTRGVIHLDLQHPLTQPSGNGEDLRWIEGTGQSCIGSPEVQTYETYGRPNTAGSDVPLEFRPKAPFVPGYTIQSMRGSWGGAKLTLSGVLGHITDTSGSTIINPNDINQSGPVTVTFRQGSLMDFTAACETLKP